MYGMGIISRYQMTCYLFSPFNSLKCVVSSGVAAIGVVLLGFIGVTGFITLLLGYYDYPTSSLYNLYVDCKDFPDRDLWETILSYLTLPCRDPSWIHSNFYITNTDLLRRNINWLIHLSLTSHQRFTSKDFYRQYKFDHTCNIIMHFIYTHSDSVYQFIQLHPISIYWSRGRGNP